MNPPLSFFANHTSKYGTETTLVAVLNQIKAGQWSGPVAAVRALYNGAGKGEAGKAAAKPAKDGLPGVTFCGRFAPRKKTGLVAHSGLIVADLDILGDRLVGIRDSVISDPFTVAAFVSPSGDGLKIVYRCDPARPHVESFHAAAAHVRQLTGEEIDPSCKDLPRLTYVTHDPDLFAASDFAAVPVLPYPEAMPTLGTMIGFDEPDATDTDGDEGDPETLTRARSYLAGLPHAVAGHGGHAATFKAALVLTWGFGLTDAAALPLLEEFNARCSPPWSDEELAHKLETSRAPSPEKPPFRWLRPLAGAPIEAAGFATDLDASARFAKAHADKLRYSPGVGWLYWDGRRWAEDAEGQAVELAKQAARDWVRREESSADGESRARRIKAALSLESTGHVKGAVELAKTDPRMVLRADKLDVNPYLLNVRNGTLDLRTGELRPHNRDDFITKLAPVKFEHGATHSTLTQYLAHVETQTPGMAAFLSRCFGAALTGDASPESLFLLQGDGGSGKTTLTEAVASLLGDYSAKLPFESFVLSRRGTSPGGARSDLMRLRGSRLAYASEGDKSAKLDAGMVKALTGNEDITAREIFAKQITFPQTWKLWLVSNFEPRADADDTGIWRRMLKIRFPVIPAAQRDPNVKRILAQDGEARTALLSWALTGCMDWQTRGGGRIGLAPPASVEAETEAYQKKQDVLGQWWEDLTSSEASLNPSRKESAATLRRRYDDWAHENGERPVTSHRFAEFLRAKGLTEVRGTGGVRCWQGIEIDPVNFFPAIPHPANAGE